MDWMFMGNIQMYQALHDYSDRIMEKFAMVLEFGSDLHFFRIITTCFGTGTCLILSVTAIFMILAARRETKLEQPNLM